MLVTKVYIIFDFEMEKSSKLSPIPDSCPTVGTRSAQEKLRQIEMVGQTSHQITGAKLPSNRQVLQAFFLQHAIRAQRRK